MKRLLLTLAMLLGLSTPVLADSGYVHVEACALGDIASIEAWLKDQMNANVSIPIGVNNTNFGTVTNGDRFDLIIPLQWEAFGSGYSQTLCDAILDNTTITLQIEKVLENGTFLRFPSGQFQYVNMTWRQFIDSAGGAPLPINVLVEVTSLPPITITEIHDTLGLGLSIHDVQMDETAMFTGDQTLDLR